MQAPDMLSKSPDSPGWIVAWRHRWKHEAGKMTDTVMTYGEAARKAADLQAGDPEKVYWAEVQPQDFQPH